MASWNEACFKGVKIPHQHVILQILHWSPLCSNSGWKRKKMYSGANFSPREKPKAYSMLKSFFFLLFFLPKGFIWKENLKKIYICEDQMSSLIDITVNNLRFERSPKIFRPSCHWFCFCSLQGEQGEQGEPGVDGATGSPGLPGEPGSDGLRGLKGEKVSSAGPELNQLIKY